ncbi:hypothetical protein D3C86_1318440 [compost metagenome]
MALVSGLGLWLTNFMARSMRAGLSLGFRASMTASRATISWSRSLDLEMGKSMFAPLRLV